MERHRHFWLWFQYNTGELQESLLHFAAERPLKQKLRHLFVNDQTADLFDRADVKANIEGIELGTAFIRTIICNHVLEHANNRLALNEIYRILEDDGLFGLFHTHH